MIHHINLVLIDDDPIQALLWKARLGEGVFYVSSVIENVQILKKILNQRRISLVFLDCELMDGSDIYRNIEILNQLGFSYLFLSTSHPPDYFKNLPMVSMVLNKEVPTWLTDYELEDLSKISQPMDVEEKYRLRKSYMEDKQIFAKFQGDLARFLKEAHQKNHLDLKPGFSKSFFATWERAVYEQVNATELEKRLAAIRYLWTEECVKNRSVS